MYIEHVTTSLYASARVLVAGLINFSEFCTMPRPYSDDLRWRMVYQKLFFEKSYEKVHCNYLLVQRLCIGRLARFLNTGDVKPCRLGRPTGSITLFPHEEYIIMDCLLRSPQMQLHEIANYISNATGSAFGPRTLQCRAVYRLGITRKKVYTCTSLPLIIFSIYQLKMHRNINNTECITLLFQS